MLGGLHAERPAHNGPAFLQFSPVINPTLALLNTFADQPVKAGVATTPVTAGSEQSSAAPPVT